MDLPLFPGADKVVHALMFFGLTMTGVYDLWRFKGYVKPLKRHVLLLSVASIIVGIVVEILQYIMSMGRSFDLPDIAADCLGAIVVFVLYRY